ncbi:MAG: hypothetical protein PQJ28_00010, partial [Spirochaetales bacterium]|nr:hypothetical protein [Spirochaetales bacterium]
MESNVYRTKWIHLRLTPSEHKEVHARFYKTACRSLSEYTRSILLDRPVVAIYRNASQDNLLGAMATLTTEL